mmetsp:Transcript_74664/g.145997  ORF Transcript_74664/g.145997 Transcript_74664/m.145997 type:complete len:301 (+) Transcript_74664:1111-2013(+)
MRCSSSFRVSKFPGDPGSSPSSPSSPPSPRSSPNAFWFFMSSKSFLLGNLCAAGPFGLSSRSSSGSMLSWWSSIIDASLVILQPGRCLSPAPISSEAAALSASSFASASFCASTMATDASWSSRVSTMWEGSTEHTITTSQSPASSTSSTEASALRSRGAPSPKMMVAWNRTQVHMSIAMALACSTNKISASLSLSSSRLRVGVSSVHCCVSWCIISSKAFSCVHVASSSSVRGRSHQIAMRRHGPNVKRSKCRRGCGLPASGSVVPLTITTAPDANDCTVLLDAAATSSPDSSLATLSS